MNPNKIRTAVSTRAGFPWHVIPKRFVITFLSVVLLGGAAGAVERPFQGRIDGQFVASPTPNPTIYVGGANAVGNATHVGSFSKVTSDVTDIATGEVVGSFTMTTANGDHVTGIYSGLIVFGLSPGSFSWVLEATITGGTGRFSNATGEFVFLAEGTFVVRDGVSYGDYTETFDGTIDY